MGDTLLYKEGDRYSCKYIQSIQSSVVVCAGVYTKQKDIEYYINREQLSLYLQYTYVTGFIYNNIYR